MNDEMNENKFKMIMSVLLSFILSYCFNLFLLFPTLYKCTHIILGLMWLLDKTTVKLDHCTQYHYDEAVDQQNTTYSMLKLLIGMVIVAIETGRKYTFGSAKIKLCLRPFSSCRNQLECKTDSIDFFNINTVRLICSL